MSIARKLKRQQQKQEVQNSWCRKCGNKLAIRKGRVVCEKCNNDLGRMKDRV